MSTVSCHMNRLCRNDVYIKNVSPLLCVSVSDGVFPVTVPSVPLYQHGSRQQWGFPKFKVRKRGGRKKIPTVIGRCQRPDQDSHTGSGRGACSNNLTQVKLAKSKDDCLNLGYMNIQSLNHKENIIENLILNKRLDLMILTETWLKVAGDECRVSQMTPNNFSTHSFPRLTTQPEERQAGGISLTFRNVFDLLIKNTYNVDFPTFELSRSQISINNNDLVLFCIFRPPPSPKNKFTCPGFIHDFEMFLDSYTVILKNFLIIGDINLRAF